MELSLAEAEGEGDCLSKVMSTPLKIVLKYCTQVNVFCYCPALHTVHAYSLPKERELKKNTGKQEVIALFEIRQINSQRKPSV